jgi:two-component system, NtrC family, nitrogen regulation sensor histidine kinase NtrY
MEQVTERRKPRKTPWLLGGAVLVLFLLLFALESSSLWRNLSIETSGDLVLLYALSSLNFLAFIVFGFIFARSIVRLIVERRTLQLGSKIKTRLLIYFFAISILPIIAMAVFSFLFMNRALERWFTQIPSDVIRETTELQNRTAAERSEFATRTARILAATIEGSEATHERLASLGAAAGLNYLSVEGRDGKTESWFAESLPDEERRQISSMIERGSGDLAGSNGLVTSSTTDGRRVTVVMSQAAQGAEAGSIIAPMTEFEKLKENELTIRQVGLLTLGVLTFLLIFASMWIAFYTARGLTNPIRALAEGAAEIGKGNLSHRVRVMAADELALLVTAFNEMSATLEGNSEEITARRRYIETVLETLPTGVFSLDTENRVTTINRAAKAILQLEQGDFSGVELDKLVHSENYELLTRVISRAKRVGFASDHTVLRRHHNGREPASDINVALTASALPDNSGCVLVIEDLSELIAAQRASAWQEVARRMAHEIKNPLTPIQLSAERIAKRFAANIQPVPTLPSGLSGIHSHQDQLKQLVDESTATIIREVESLKAMVEEFSRFAKLPDVKLEPGNVNEVVRQAVEVFNDRFADIEIEVEQGGLPPVQLDLEQLKRVFVNLIENSAEAFSFGSADKRITISTRHDFARDLVVAQVADNGKGIDPADLQKLFLPYFSTKGRGTGLGLAIVRRIIAEHSGRIYAAANPAGGAKFVIELPVFRG